VIKNAFEAKDEEVHIMKHRDEYNRLKLEELTDEVRKS